MKAALFAVLVAAAVASICWYFLAGRRQSVGPTPPSHQIASIVPTEASRQNDSQRSPARRPPEEAFAFGQYVLTVHRSEDACEGSFEVRRKGRTVLSRSGYRFYVGRFPDEEDSFPRDKIGKDINGDGVPDIVVWEWTGGVHACFLAHVVELRGDCRVLTTIDGVDSIPHFQDLDGDGKLEVVVRDCTYAYWPGCFASSPLPEVILRWQKGKYHVASDLMKRGRLFDAGLRERAKVIRESSGWSRLGPGYSRWEIPQELFETALDLMYCGREERGWQFIREAWRPGYEFDEGLVKELHALMAQSPYWRELKRVSK